MKRLAVALAALLAAPASAGVLFSQTVVAQGGAAYLDAAFGALGGELWVKASGGLIESAWLDVEGDHSYAWWRFAGYDENGNAISILEANNGPTGVACSWDASAVGYCDFNGTLDRGLFHGTVPAPPPSYDHCIPFDGVYDQLCRSVTQYDWTYFNAWASAEDGAPVTFAIYDTNPGVPEPGAWALLVAGLALTGTALRWRRGAREVGIEAVPAIC